MYTNLEEGRSILCDIISFYFYFYLFIEAYRHSHSLFRYGRCHLNISTEASQVVSSLSSLLQETYKHFSIAYPSSIYNGTHGVYPAWFLMPCGAIYSDINLTTFCKCLKMGEAKASQLLLKFCQIKRRHIPDDTTLNFIIAAGTTSRPPDAMYVVTSCKFVTGYRVFGWTYKHMFRGK
jgi:hypothetical protein